MSTIEIEIGRGRKRSGVVKIDECSVPLVSSRRWYIDKYGYAYSTIRKGRNVGMHRLIINAPDGLEVDHRNGNTLDNRLENLRLCAHEENMRNRRRRRDNACGLKGATFVRRTGRWRAQIGINGKNRFLGDFATPEEAHAAYGRAAVALHGEFARPA